MNYKILISNKSIPTDIYHKLIKYNCIVPYDFSTPSVNLYVYVPLDDPNLEKIKSLHPFNDYQMEVTQTEVDKHINKIKSVNKVSKGDIVFIEQFKKVPFQVESVNSDDTVTVFIPLRGITHYSNIDKTLISKAEDYSIYKPNPIKRLDKKIVFDFDTDMGLYTKTMNDYIYSLFLFLLRIKSSYGGFNPVFLNPPLVAEKFALAAGIEVVYGVGILNINSSSMIYSSNRLVLASLSSRVYLKYDKIVEVNQTIDEYYFIIYKRYIKDKQLPKMINSSNNFLNSLKGLSIHSEFMEYVDSLPKKESMYIDYRKGYDFTKLQRIMQDTNFGYLIHNLEHFIRIIRQ